jgi:hypothetical protein
MSEYIEFNALVLFHCAVTSKLFIIVVLKVVLFTVLKANPSCVAFDVFVK